MAFSSVLTPEGPAGGGVFGGVGPSTSASQTTSTSTGTPQVLNTPQSDYSLAFAREAQQAGQQLYGWAGKQYQYLQNLAGQAIPQFLQAGASANAMANQQFGQYMNTYAPAMERFNEMASSYASPARQAYAMGQAEADATQNANAAWQNTQKDLQSYGIDPSSGMYAGLKSAAQTAAGASAAGAANQARQGVENTGIGLQEQNINFGQSLPASALNAVNAENTALSGAVNTGESTVNTGVNAYNNANNFFQTAQQLKLPVSGQGSTSNSQSNSYTQGKVPTYSASGNVGFGGQALGQITYQGAKGGVIPDSHGGLPDDDSYRRGGHVRHGGHGGGGRGMGGGATGKPRMSGSFGRTGFSTVDSDAQIRQNAGSGGTGFNTVDSDAEIRARTGGGLHSPQGLGTTNSPPPKPSRGGGLTLPSQPTDQPPPGPQVSSGLPDQNAPPSGGVPMDPSMGAARGGSMEPPGHFGRPHPPHPYHTNGLPDASTGGHVPYELSPSHGHTTDDVVANLNAGEFVIPRRTVHHLGHKFLYDLIGKSDKEMGLHPQPVGAEPVKAGSGAAKARDAATSQNFSNGGGI